MSDKAKDANPRELFEAAVSWYDRVEKDFNAFRLGTVIGDRYGKALGDFIHEARKYKGNCEFALGNDELPEIGRVSVRWRWYNDTLTNIRLMELILELAGKKES